MIRPILAATAVTALAGGALADIVNSQNNNALSLATSLLAPSSGINIVGAQLYNPWGNDSMSSGTFVTDGASNTYGMYGNGMTGGVVLSTGNVSDYESGPNTAADFTTNYGTPANGIQNALLVPVGGAGNYYDITELVIQFTVTQNASITLNAVFGSEEYPLGDGSPFIDAFAIYLNGNNIAFVNGLPTSASHPWLTGVAGTELDGLLQNPSSGGLIHSFSGSVLSNQINYLHIIIGDKENSDYDSTLWLSGFAVPAPGALALMGVAFATGRRRSRR